MPKDDGEKKILEALDQSRHGRRYANVSTADGRLLRQLTEAVGARRVVELGTSTGESGLWFSMALRKTGGHLYTHDIDPGRIAVARENFKKGSVEDLATIVEGDTHRTATKNTDPIDVLFIDADKEGYDAYLRELLPYVRPGGLIISHNMRRPAPNPRYVEAITTGFGVISLASVRHAGADSSQAAPRDHTEARKNRLADFVRAHHQTARWARVCSAFSKGEIQKSRLNSRLN